MTMTIEPTIAALGNFRCSRCDKDKPCVMKVESQLICLECRYDDIGKDALYEALYNGLD